MIIMGKNIFASLFGNKTPNSGTVAKDRLRFVIAQDRATIPEAMMEQIRVEILQVLSKYIDIDQDHLGLEMEREGSAFMLRADIPVRRVRSNPNENKN
jgi:cell division topological specificity factor